MIELIRIDDRLIHGQVIMSWVKRGSIDYILAVADDIDENSFQTKLMKMATPPGYSSEILTSAGAIELLKSGKIDNKKIFIVAKGAKEVLDLIDAGFDMPKNINVGNVRQNNGITIISYILIAQEDLDNWKRLSEKVKLTAQLTPDQTAHNLNEALLKAKYT